MRFQVRSRVAQGLIAALKAADHQRALKAGNDQIREGARIGIRPDLSAGHALSDDPAKHIPPLS